MSAIATGTTDILMVGVGGQGIILASDVLSQVAMDLGRDVKKSEVHGMSQRGGTVTSHVRFGPRVWSPIIPEGRADFLLAFEIAEALRALHLVAPEGRVIASRQRIIPPIASKKGFAYPENPEAQIRDRYPNALVLDALGECRALGNEKMVSVLLLGVLSAHLDFDLDAWKPAIAHRVPAGSAEINWGAFLRGRELAGA